MPRVIETTVFKYDELSDDAKTKARAWYTGDGFEFFYDFVYDDFETICNILGIDIAAQNNNQNIAFSGFWSQGDGASFWGTYRYKKQSVKKLIEHAPTDTELHRIARELYAAQKNCFYKLEAKITTSGLYCHSNTMHIDTFFNDDNYRTIPAATDDAITQALRDLANWLYKTLEKEYDYQVSDDAVSDTIRANEYEFTIDGNIA